MKLVICEKNIAARRIAYILSSGKTKSKRLGKIPAYEFEKDKELWNIVGLKGHIINLDYPADYNQWTKITPKELAGKLSITVGEALAILEGYEIPAK